MKTLLLMRHAKTEGSDPRGSDHERQLTSRGKRDAGRIGTLLSGLEVQPDQALISDAVRTRQTWQCLSVEAQISCEVTHHRALYLAPPKAYLELIVGLSETIGTVLFIGHNPGIEALIRQCATKALQPADEINVAQPLRTGTLCGFQFDGRWTDFAQDKATLSLFLRP